MNGTNAFIRETPESSSMLLPCEDTVRSLQPRKRRGPLSEPGHAGTLVLAELQSCEKSTPIFYKLPRVWLLEEVIRGCSCQLSWTQTIRGFLPSSPSLGCAFCPLLLYQEPLQGYNLERVVCYSDHLHYIHE